MTTSGNGIYQKVIRDKENLELYLAMCQAKFKEEIPENVFDNNVIVLTIVNARDIRVKTNIGNLRYYYDNNGKYSYIAHLYVVSKIVNYNCIYNVDNESIKAEANMKDMNDEYNEKVDDLDTNIFVKENENSSTTGNNEENTSASQAGNNETASNTQANTQEKIITREEADKIAEQGFQEAERIAGKYSKDTQEVTEEEVFANNFFTRKTYEADKVYNDKPKVECYVYTRTDDIMLNGVSIYIDKKTGKIIGGRAFGD